MVYGKQEDGYLPTFALIGKVRRHESKIAPEVPLSKGSIVAMDRAYCDFGLFGGLDRQGDLFRDTNEEIESVPPLRNVSSSQEQQRPFGRGHPSCRPGAEKKCPYFLRRVVVFSTFNWSLSNLVAFLRWILFTYRDLWKWIDAPFLIPPVPPQSVQEQLLLPVLGQQ